MGPGKLSDRTILTVFKFVGMTDSAGVPTDMWRALRANDRKPLAKGMREAYKELYDIDYDAHNKSDADLETFFRKKIDKGKRVIESVIATYRALCSMADFNGSPSASDATEISVPHANGQVAMDAGTAAMAPTASGYTGVVTQKGPMQYVASAPSGVTVNINIQLTLPENATKEDYEAFFKAMKECFLS